MSWLIIYKFTLFTALTWMVFFIIMLTKLTNFNTISFSGNEIRIKKKTSGTYGKFSFQVSLTSPSSEIFSRSYKTLAFSNGFIKFEALQKAHTVWAVVSKNKSSNGQYEMYSIADHKPGWYRIFLEMVSYVINNYTLIICIPLVLTFILCGQEFGSEYQFENSKHQAVVSITYIFNALFIALIALY
ncbi:hypothetical protein [Pedobacter agri]|uniref:hypothetical protein n=1 Tax=Pedobacter agri TaxID=454586 RepID=UPI00292E89A1|nr:hypothetical protein [Pedobacter agri]